MPSAEKKPDGSTTSGLFIPPQNIPIFGLSNKGSSSSSESPSKRKKIPSRDSPSEEGCFQVGKVRKGKFNVDFRFPISPVQAFAAALTTFNWTAKET